MRLFASYAIKRFKYEVGMAWGVRKCNSLNDDIVVKTAAFVCAIACVILAILESIFFSYFSYKYTHKQMVMIVERHWQMFEIGQCEFNDDHNQLPYSYVDELRKVYIKMYETEYDKLLDKYYDRFRENSVSIL